ncbi:MAG: hypothetical protein ACKOGB_01115, partial [Betaproteobacteria bacterium]
MGLDTTSGLWTGYGHLALACAPEPPPAAPLTGSVDPCNVELRHEVRLQRLAPPAQPQPGAAPSTEAPLELAQDLRHARPKQELTMGPPFDE